MKIELILFPYFVINAFLAGFFLDSFSLDKKILIPVIGMLFLGIPIIVGITLYEVFNKIFIDIDNFLLISVQRSFEKGKFDDLNDYQIKRIEEYLHKAKFKFQKRIYQSIIDKNNESKNKKSQ